MGFKKIKRPILAPGGLQVSGGSTFTGSVVTSGVGITNTVQTLTSASTATVINAYGITTMWQTTAGTTDQTWKLAGATVGAEKTILFNAGQRTITITCTANGTDPFYKSTNTSSLVGTSNVDNDGVIELTGVTSIMTGATGIKWAVQYLSTAISIS